MKNKTGLGMVVAAAAAMALAQPVSAALFSQDFSGSTNAVDYVGNPPTHDQFSNTNGFAMSIDAERLKLVNEAGTAGYLGRWVAMEGSPVGAMSFSYEVDFAFSEAAGTRLSTSAIGEPGGKNWMAWGIEATGTDNEWNLTGSSGFKFSGAQTVAIFMNDTDDAFYYVDPVGGTQTLANASYDVWVGTTLVQDGRSGVFVHPEYDPTVFNIGLNEIPAVTVYFDNFQVEILATQPIPVPDSLFSQDFSDSTTVDDYIGAGTPTRNQFSLINGVASSIDAGRLKLVNADGAAGNLRRWVAMEGTPVEAMSFSYEMDLAFSEADNTRLFTGAIGEPASKNWMAWGVDATGTDNEWNVTGTTNTFTGAQTLTIFMNDSASAVDYADPASGTQSLASNSYDLWVGATQVLDGRSGVFVHPEYDLTVFNIGFSAASAVTYYFDNFLVKAIQDPGYAGWAAGWGGIDIGPETDDYDGDGLLNVYEYGLGGDPTNELDQGTSPEFGVMDIGGTDWFAYIHPQLSDPDSGLAYSLALKTDLVFGDWTTNSGYTVSGTNVTGGKLDFVTNVTDTVDETKYIRLIIE